MNYQINLDPWQKEFLSTKGDKILCCGRQIGKSVICSIDAGEWAVANPKQNVLIIAPTERQAYALFEKTLQFLMENHKDMICKGKDRPTQTRIILKNKSKIFCLPTGLAGTGVRFLTIGRLYGDEAAYIPEPVWTAVTPMLLTTGGNMVLLSTPSGSENFFAEVVENRGEKYNSFTRFQYNSEEVIKNRPICHSWTEFQREKALEHLAREKERKTKLEYAQEYEGQILSALRQFFPSDLIKGCMKRDRGSKENYGALYGIVGARLFLGVDLARQGSDNTVYAEVIRYKKDHLLMSDLQIRKEQGLTETARELIDAQILRRYNCIYLDDNGLGSGVLDMLLDHPKTKKKVVGINNTKKSVDHEDGKRRSMKHDLYFNLKRLMEQGKIELFNEPEILQSLASIQIDYEGNHVKIFGKYDHIAEALVRAAWCTKDKGLNIYAYFI